MKGKTPICYMGNGPRGVACLRALLGSGEAVVGVVVHPGPEEIVSPGSVKELALQNGIQTIQPRQINSPEAISVIRQWEPDLVVLSGYNQIIKSEVIKIPPMGCINLHGGKLPEYRGTAPLNWAIINGEERIGLSIIYVDEGIDTGDIIAQREFAVSPDDTIGDVVGQSVEIFPTMLLDVIEQIKRGTVKRTRQDPKEGTYYTRRYPQDGIIKWESMDAMEVCNLVRALTKPYPGAFTFLEGKKLFVWKAAALDEDIRGTPGRVCLKKPDGAVVIAKDRGLLLKNVQLEGRASCDANALLKPLGITLG